MFELIKVTIIVFLLSSFLFAQNETVELRNIQLHRINVAGFTLEQNRTVKITCIGASEDKKIKRINNYQLDPENMFAYAWIINAKTREMIWRMTIDNSDGDFWDKWNREFEGNINLTKGEYELYFSAIEPSYSSGFISIESIFKGLFESDDYWEEQSEDWKVVVESVDAVLSEQAVRKYQRALKDQAIISLTPAGDRSYMTEGFRVDETIQVEIYAIGEGWKGDVFDYGWLIDADSRKKVWMMRENHTRHAGGAIKNRVTKDKITLNPGNYILYYKTDDNHSHDEWNSNPPYDPEFWGVTVFPADRDFNPDVISTFTEEQQSAVLVINRVGDNEYEEEGLIVEADSRFRIYAIGEGRGGEMFDFGWITDAKTGRKVWEMDYRRTEHAGGADKNRQVDDVLELEKGEYLVHYRTDGSHSYEDWNSAEPYDQESWGISIFPIGKNIKARRISSSTFKSENVIAELTRIGDSEHVRKQFNIDKRTRVRIICIGEGSWDEMYDYGWIENDDTGRRVWRMRHRNTDHAGGASKNRIVDTIITLEPGSYTVHYESDDSHSFRDWNATPPNNEKAWGITLYRIDYK